MKKRSKTIKLYICLTILLTLLSGCGTKETSAEITSVESTETENVAEQITSNDSSSESTNVEAVTNVDDNATDISEETTEESSDVTYEGIDFESTLPGTEWIETFVGVIDEPKIVVFNDKTNKKRIFENEDPIYFNASDSLAIYSPEGSDKIIQYTSFFGEGESSLDYWLFEESTPVVCDHSLSFSGICGLYNIASFIDVNFIVQCENQEYSATCFVCPYPDVEFTYNAIDTNSTLPGQEWVESFSGNITEPKFVVYNDSTNKKIILENGQNIDFCEGDCFAIFSPESHINISQDLWESFISCTLTDYALHYSNPVLPTSEEYGPETIEAIVKHNNTKTKLSCTLTYK